MEITIDPSLSVCSKQLPSQSTTAYGSEVVKQLGAGSDAEVEFVSPCPGLVECGYDKSFGLETHNSFVEAVHTAFARHYPLVLSPDVLWLCIVQGLAQHVNLQSEELRHQFVDFSGKQTIVVHDDTLVRGGRSDWTPVLGQFTAELRNFLGDEVVEKIMCDFSTSTPVSLAASQVALMDAMSSYFSYECVTECGIPRVTLEGTTSDWQRLLDKTLYLRQYGLAWWIDELKLVLQKLVEASRGTVDQDFWKSFYKIRQMSGGPYINGWILAFFPYLVSPESPPARNEHMGHWRKSEAERGQFDLPAMVTSEDLPCGMASAPFVWQYYGTSYKMRFLSGFFGVEQDESTLALKPHIGFAVVEPK